jgi:hypothetical protein
VIFPVMATFQPGMEPDQENAAEGPSVVDHVVATGQVLAVVLLPVE